MKRILAIVLSIAILVMAFPLSVFATESTIDTWDGSRSEPTTTDEDGNIIINTAEELAWIALSGDDATKGKSYKVADGITAFYLTPNGAESYDNSSFDRLKETLTAETDLLGSTINKWVCKAYVHAIGGWASFQGSFDGNGITIYGLPGQSTETGSNGLFPYIKGDVSFKNIIITDSYISSNNNVGAIFGSTFNNTNTLNSISVEKCFVIGNYLEQAKAGSTNGWNNVAGLGGSIGVVTKSVLVDNCAIVDNHIVNASAVNNVKTRAFFGNFLNYDTAVVSVSIKNSFTDLNTYANGYYPNNNANYSNIYTTNTDAPEFYSGHDVKVLASTADMKGSAAQANMNLAWNTDWFVGEAGEYPTLNFGEPYVDPYVWDGSFTEPTSTDEDGNIIINTAAEMAWIALRGDTATEGKSYKVADGIEYFDMNGSQNITINSSAAEVKASTATSNVWKYAADNKVGAFRGKFDGNGVTIYNIRTASYGYGALFPFVLNDVTIENVKVKASFIVGYHYAGGIVGSSEIQTKTVDINKCVVENCYIGDNGNTNTACKRAASGILAGTGNSNVNIANCAVYNNIISAAGYEAAFIALSGDYIAYNGGLTIKNSFAVGITPYSVGKINSIGKGLLEKLTVENVYSDVACDIAGYTTLTTDKMQGAAAKANMNFAWNTDWFVGEAGEYPTINFGEPVKDPYLWDGTFVEPTTTDNDGNIIINTAAEMAWIALRGDTATEGKSYKVADGIEYFDMNGSQNITINSSAAEVKASTATSNVWKYAADDKVGAFRGKFDGNGVTIYNIRTASYGYGALFPFVLNDVTIENVKVKASFIVGYHFAGGIVGSSEIQTKTVDINKCVVENCYIGDNGNTNTACRRAASGILAGTGNSNVNIANCAVYNNIISAAGYEAAFIAQSGDYIAYNGGLTIKNSFAAGITPYSVGKINSIGKGLLEKLTVENVYSDVACNIEGYITLDTDKMQGAVASIKMENLDSSIWFFNTTTYPDLLLFHNVANGKCDDCGLIVAGDPCANGHKLVSIPAIDPTNFTNGNLAHDKCSVCDKTFIGGVEKSADEIIVPMLAKTWNGTFVEPTTTDANGNIVINTPEELAWVALRGGAATDGKKYIVAKDSMFNMDGMVDITPFSSVADVKNATKNENKKWQFEADNNSVIFKGNFDGNGLTVYNVYTGKGRYAGGLFPEIKANAGETISIKNITVLSSHIGGYHYAGGIVGLANAPTTDTKFTLENCVVKNTYIYDNNDANSACQRTTGVLVGNLGHNATTINNCLVADNEISAQGIIGGIFGNSSAYCSSITVKNVISVGTSIQPMMVNYLISDKVSQAVYSNVYTDQIASADGITILNTAQMKGAAAADNMSLNWNINWKVGNEGEYPSIITDNSFYDEWDGSFVEPTKTDAEGNVIITSAEEMAWVALRGGAATEGKSYKVADGIKYFNMNGMSGITITSTVEDVKDAVKTTNLWRFAADDRTNTFKGNFDGNGVTVYNVYSGKGHGYAGLFPATKPADNTSLTIKNVAVVASSFGAYHNAGAIVGLTDANSSAVTLLLENCIVKECFISDNNDQNNACQRTAGVFVGNIAHNITTINNCLAVNNEISAQGIIGGIFGNASEYSGGINVSNVISIGTSVESASVNYAISSKVANAVYENVYTDQATILEGVTTLSIDALSGKNAISNTLLDWNAWFATNSLPELRVFHTIIAVDNGDGTHNEICDDCKAGGFASNHNYDNDYDATCNDCGAVREVANLVVGDTSGDGVINNKDLAVLMQYINGWDVPVFELAADVNKDGKVNNKDYALLIRYINGWDVTIG